MSPLTPGLEAEPRSSAVNSASRLSVERAEGFVRASIGRLPTGLERQIGALPRRPATPPRMLLTPPRIGRRDLPILGSVMRSRRFTAG
jgi:hypothetical protein